MNATAPSAATPAESPTDQAQPTQFTPQSLPQVRVYADPTEPRDATRPAPRASRWLRAQVEAG